MPTADRLTKANDYLESVRLGLLGLDVPYDIWLPLYQGITMAQAQIDGELAVREVMEVPAAGRPSPFAPSPWKQVEVIP